MEFKRIYDSKVRPHTYYVGQTVWLHDPVKKEGECTKIRRRWKGPLTISEKIGDYNVKLVNAATNKVLERIVHVDRLKPCYLPDTEERVNKSEESETEEEEEEELGKDEIKQAITRDLKESQEITNGKEPTESSEEYFLAKKILKQKTVQGTKWYLIRWEDENSENTWSKESDVTDALLKAWHRTHTKKGKLRKNKQRD